MESQFAKNELSELRRHFKLFDVDGDGHITVDELGQVLKKIGQGQTPVQLKELIKEVDLDKSGTIEWEEFLTMVKALKEGKSSGFGQQYQKAKVKLNVMEGSAAGISHSFSDEEKVAFVDYINSVLADDPDLQDILPVPADDMSLFAACGNGLLLCKLINVAVPDTISEKAICKKKKMTVFNIQENQNVVVQSAKAIGCNVVNIGGSDLMSGTPHLVLGLVWQIVKIGLLSQISLKNHPNLVRLLEPGEELEDFLKLSPEQILLRWFNYHLKAANWPRRVANFGPDIKDSENYTVLLSQIAPEHCNRDGLKVSDLTDRAESVLEGADKIECRKFVKPKDIVQGNTKLNLAFVANLFNTWPALEPPEEGMPVFEEEDESDAREERAFRIWINSMGVDPEVKNLFDDLADGVILLQLMDKIEPGCVDWKRVQKKPKNKFMKVGNCNYAVDLGKQLGFSLVGVGGKDILDGNKKLTLAVVWQCMRLYILKFIASLQKGGKQISEQDLVDWANQLVADSGKSTSIRNFRDQSLKNSAFLLDLLDAVKPGCVDPAAFESGVDDESLKANAKYAITIGRKIGCNLFLLWEDIVEVKPKMLLTMVGAIRMVAP